ncbi:hypothetical protein [Candidatus Leptofilum sp.]|uniref:hypothetical protein n=1 Tax=Candidatus Leptofilum sp. TaxID=3241576 RepID=UPI003B5B0A2E
MNHFLALRHQKVWQHFSIYRALTLLILFLIFTMGAVSCSDPQTPTPENNQPSLNEATPVPNDETEEDAQEILNESGTESSGTEAEEEANNQSSDPEIPENENPFAGLNQDWIPNLGSLRPIPNVQITGVNAPLTVGQMGAWQDEAPGNKVAYGFTLTNTSADHYITNVQYLVTFTDAGDNVVNEHKVESVRDFYPLETINLGESYFPGSTTAYELVKISIISAEAIPISDTPLSLEWRSSFVPSATGIWLLQESAEEDSSLEDTNEVQFSFNVSNPNANFVATNSTFSINILDAAGNILGQGQGNIGDIQPLRGWDLKGSIFVESPDLIAETEIVIEPEEYTPVDPTTLPTRLIPKDQVSFTNQNANIIFPGLIDFEFHLTEIITNGGFDYIFAIAYDSDGNAIGGGTDELLSTHLNSTAQSVYMPIRASGLPDTIELYFSYDFIDDDPGRGGGGSHPGRDI